VPDETNDLRFRHLLEQHGLNPSDLQSITGLLEERRLLLRSGTIVDATIIAAPSSTKNASATRDPEMKQTHKGRNWHFGMKLHIGADKRGIVHTVRADRSQRSRHHSAAGSAARAERSCSAIKRTGRKTIASFSRRGECAIGSTGAPPPSGP